MDIPENELEKASHIPMSEEDLLQVHEFYTGVAVAGKRVTSYMDDLKQGTMTISQVRWDILRWYGQANQPQWPSPPLAQCAGEKWVYRQALIHLKFPLPEYDPPTTKEKH